MAVTAAVVAGLLSFPSAAAAGDQAESGREETALWNGFWYGRYLIDHVALGSGLGVPFEPPASFVARMAEAAAPGEDTAAVPDGAVFLQAVYAGGQPAGSGGTEPWTELETEITPHAQAMAILAEVEAARVLAADDGDPGSAAGSLGRLRAQLYLTEAKAQADFAMVNMIREDGFYGAVDWADGEVRPLESPPRLVDQYLMLRALSELGLLLTPDSPYGGVYADEAFASWFRSGAESLFEALAVTEPERVDELAKGILALTRYAALVDDPASRRDALASADGLAGRLAALVPASSVERAHVVRGLAELAAVTGAGDRDAVLDATARRLLGAYQRDRAVFADAGVLTTGDVGTLVGALHAYRVLRTGTREATTIEATLASFIDAVVSSSGMMRAVPDPASILDSVEIDAASADDLGHPAVPRTSLPPVLLEEVAFDVDDGRWEVVTEYFDTATGLYAASELLRLRSNTSPFAPLPATTPVPAVAAATAASVPQPIVVDVESTEFAFTPSSITVPAGAEVTLRLRNAGVAPHNIDIPDLGVFVFVDAGGSGAITFTVPEATGAFGFVCNIPGHADGGMVGDLVVEPGASPPPAPAEATPEVPPVAPVAEAGVLPPVEVIAERERPSSLLPSLVLAAGLVLAMAAFVTGMVRFSRSVGD